MSLLHHGPLELFLESAILWLISFLMFFGTLVSLLNAKHLLNHLYIKLGLIISATTILLHNQIDLGMVDIMAAPLLFSIIGLAAAEQNSNVDAHHLHSIGDHPT